jgi:dTMP kinase
MSGLFITFEGLDFSGKTEQTRRLAEALRAAKYEVELVREPGGVEIAEAIRAILLDAKHGAMTDHTELLLYSAARAQITKERIQPALVSGKIVIADRFADSTTVYQGFGRQIDLDFVRHINRFATWEITPDLTFLLEISFATAEARWRQSGRTVDRLEREDRAFHERVWQGYQQLTQAEPERFVILNGEQSIDAIASQIHETLRQRFGLKI